MKILGTGWARLSHPSGVLVFGLLAIKRQGLYFAMITLALAQMNYFFCLQAPFTGGEDGIQQVPRGALFGVFSLSPDMSMYLLVAAVFVIFFLLIHRIVHSPFGQVLKAIRENEPRATSLGYRTDDYKLVAFILSTFIAGIAGGTKALVFGIATLTDVHYAMSGEVVLMNLLGGMGTIFGPVVGAGIIGPKARCPATAPGSPSPRASSSSPACWRSAAASSAKSQPSSAGRFSTFPCLPISGVYNAHDKQRGFNP